MLNISARYAGKLGRVAAFIAALAAVALPLASPADTALRTTNYRTAYVQTEPVPSAGEYAGRLTLTFYQSGIINGRYRSESGSSIHNVTGGFKGTSIWLSFGMRGMHQMSGNIGEGGKITGVLTGSKAPAAFRFTAVPTP